LTRLDLPALGGPTTAIVRPARSRSPRCPSTRCAPISADSRQTSGRITSSRFSGTSSSGAIDLGLDPSERLQERLPPAFIKPAQCAIELAQRLTRLRPRLGVDEIGQAFHGGEIETAVEKCPARKLARVRGAHTCEAGQRVEQTCDDRPAAVHLELEQILSGEAPGPREPQDEPLVDGLSTAGIEHGAEGRPARGRRRTSRQTPADVGGCRA
jgi:hypothetical protein